MLKYGFLTMALLAGVFVSGTAMAEDAASGAGPLQNKGEHRKKLDTDGDGKINKSEFMSMQEKKFSKIDADGDGFLTREEMKEARGKMREKMQEWREKKGSGGGLRNGLGRERFGE